VSRSKIGNPLAYVNNGILYLSNANSVGCITKNLVDVDLITITGANIKTSLIRLKQETFVKVAEENG